MDRTSASTATPTRSAPHRTMALSSGSLFASPTRVRTPQESSHSGQAQTLTRTLRPFACADLLVLYSRPPSLSCPLSHTHTLSASRCPSQRQSATSASTTPAATVSAPSLLVVLRFSSAHHTATPPPPALTIVRGYRSRLLPMAPSTSRATAEWAPMSRYGQHRRATFPSRSCAYMRARRRRRAWPPVAVATAMSTRLLVSSAQSN